MARDDVAPLIVLADKISHESACAQARDIRALAARRTALTRAHRIPPAFQAPLSSAVGALVVQAPPCLPDVPASTSQTTPSVTVVSPGRGHGHGHGRERKHKNKHKHHGDADEGGD
jgi:hypothetical protein